MTLVDDVPAGSVVGLDTAPLIYWMERHSTYFPVVESFFRDRLDMGVNEGVTSTVSLAEVLVLPFRLGRNDLLARYRDFLSRTRHLSLAPISAPVAERSAELRARYGLRLPDAFQVAVALDNGASHFLTNDDGLRRVTELRVLVLKDYLPPSGP